MALYVTIFPIQISHPFQDKDFLEQNIEILDYTFAYQQNCDSTMVSELVV